MSIARTLASLTLGLLLTAAAFDAASAKAAKLVIPKATCPPGQAYSPHTIAAKLAKEHFKVLQLFRKGQAYAIVANGPSGNKVQMTVDGASGRIVGLAILRRAKHAKPHQAAAHRTDDTKPFGAVVPLAAFRNWTAYKEADWHKPAAAMIPVTYSYAPYREALPYAYYVALPGHDTDAIPVAPPNYVPYDVYDPDGVALSNALDAADDAEYRAALAEADANYETARADLAEADNAALSDENAALRDELDAIQNEPPQELDEPPPAENSLEPDPGENLDTFENTGDMGPNGSDSDNTSDDTVENTGDMGPNGSDSDNTNETNNTGDMGPNGSNSDNTGDNNDDNSNDNSGNDNNGDGQ